MAVRAKPASGAATPPPAEPAAAPRAIRFVEDAGVSELFAMDAQWFGTGAGVVMITLTCDRWDHTSAPGGVLTRAVVGRLVMPAAGAMRLAGGLYDFLVKNGMDPSPRPLAPMQ